MRKRNAALSIGGRFKAVAAMKGAGNRTIDAESLSEKQLRTLETRGRAIGPNTA